MANKRFNKQVPGYGFQKGSPDKGTEATVGKVSPQMKKMLLFLSLKKLKTQ